jgi:hypothetical protein
VLLNDSLNIILNVSREYLIKTPSIVGGLPRDMHLGKDIATKDVDITTNDADIIRLSVLSSESLGVPFKIFSDGHSSIYMDDYILDFSSNFRSKNGIEYIGKEKGITDPDLFEVYSRDFTMNTLHKSVDEEEITDPTGEGKRDIDDGVIRTVLPPGITLNDDLRRVFRAIKLASKYGFEIHEDIISFTRENLHKFSNPNSWSIKEGYITTVIGEAIAYDEDKTISNIDDMGLLPVIPLSGMFKDYLIKTRMLDKYFKDLDRLGRVVDE